MTATAKQILVVDDDPAMTQLLRDFLSRQGYSVATSSSVVGALSWLRSQSQTTPPDLVLSDVKLGGPSGIDLAKKVAVEWPSLPVVLFSVSEDMEEEALKSGARCFLRKPFSLAKLARTLEEEMASFAD